jgi:uncharacterized protein YpmB
MKPVEENKEKNLITMVHFAMIYGTEVWNVSRKNRKEMLATEIDFSSAAAMKEWQGN